MNEAKKSFDPWRLVLILVCAVGFIGGIYLLNLTINTRFDAVDGAVTSGTGTTAIVLDKIDKKVSDIQTRLDEMSAKLAAPAPAPAPAEAPAPEAAPAPAPEKAE